MNPKLLLRIAAIIMLLHALGHSFGHANWKKAPEPEKQEVIKQMTGHKFPFMGAVHSMADYYDGYGYISLFNLLLIAGLLWIVSGFAYNNAAIAVKILLAVSVFLLVLGVLELIYFFPFAASFSLLAGILSAVSAWQLKKIK